MESQTQTAQERHYILLKMWPDPEARLMSNEKSKSLYQGCSKTNWLPECPRPGSFSELRVIQDQNVRKPNMMKHSHALALLIGPFYPGHKTHRVHQSVAIKGYKPWLYESISDLRVNIA